MIQEHIEQIEAKVEAAENISSETKGELLNLLAKLKSEIAALPEQHLEDAQSIALFADVSTQEATRTERKPRLIEAALQGLTSSAEEFEASHPELAQAANRLAAVLSNMGI